MTSGEQQIEGDPELIDKNIHLKECKHCKMKINATAKVCHHCNKNQNYIWFYLDKFAIVGSIILVLLAYLQYYEAQQKNIQANEALNEARDAKSKVSKLDKIISESQERLEDLKVNADKATNEAKDAKSKVKELDKIIVESTENLDSLQKNVKFMEVLLGAQNDDWEAYNQLHRWSKDSSHPLYKVALNATIKIRSYYGGPISPGHLNISWKKGTDPNKLSLARLKNNYYNLEPVLHADLVQVIWDKKRYFRYR